MSDPPVGSPGEVSAEAPDSPVVNAGGGVPVTGGFIDDRFQALFTGLVEKVPMSGGEALASAAQLEALRSAMHAVRAVRTDTARWPDVDEAFLALERGETAKAEALLKELRDRKKASDANNRKRTAEVWRHLGAFASLHDAETAVAAYRKAVELDPDSPEGWNLLGHLLRRAGNLAQAEEAYKRVRLVSRSDDFWTAVAAGNFGLLAQARDEVAAAKESFERSLELHKALGRELGIAALLGMGDDMWTALFISEFDRVAQSRGDLEATGAFFRRSLKLYEALGSDQEVAAQLSNLGLVAKTRGDLEAAEEYFKRSQRGYEDVGNDSGIAAQLRNLGLVAMARGDLNAGKGYLTRSVKLNEAIDNKKGLAASFFHLGALAESRCQQAATEGFLQRSVKCKVELAMAEGFFERSLKLNEALGSRKGMAVGLFSLGRLAETRRELAVAEGFFERSVEVSKSVGAKKGMAMGLLGLERCRKPNGTSSRGLLLNQAADEDFFKRSLKLNEALGNREGIARDLGNLAGLAQIRGALDAAQDFHKQALELHEALGNMEAVAMGLLNLTLPGRGRGDPVFVRNFVRNLELRAMIAQSRGELVAAENIRRQALRYKALGGKEGHGGEPR
ncbi:MAG: tetratricopeptide repeat protein [Myxococcales bacterium]|nr:tetratricopeptide repeat protein [Myxococcales bacterium]